VPRATAPGEPLIIEAVILDRACQPAADASVHLWHTDSRGLYAPTGQECCYYQGTVNTDHNGRLRIRSIRPAQYPGANAASAHIHFEIRHATASLDTEIVFADSVPSHALEPPTGQELPIALRRDGAAWRGEALFVLR